MACGSFGDYIILGNLLLVMILLQLLFPLAVFLSCFSCAVDSFCRCSIAVMDLEGIDVFTPVPSHCPLVVALALLQPLAPSLVGADNHQRAFSRSHWPKVT